MVGKIFKKEGFGAIKCSKMLQLQLSYLHAVYTWRLEVYYLVWVLPSIDLTKISYFFYGCEKKLF